MNKIEKYLTKGKYDPRKSEEARKAYKEEREKRIHHKSGKQVRQELMLIAFGISFR